MGWSLIRYLVQNEKKGFRFGWLEMLDGPAWLYGAAVLAFQQWWKTKSHPREVGLTIGWPCVIAAAVCVIIVVAILEERRKDPDYRPPRSVHVVALFIMITVMVVGYRIQCLVSPG